MIFADDTKLLEQQDDLRTFLEWAELWELTFIVLKCKIIHYGLNNSEHEYTMNNQQLKPVEEECDLGVTFSRDLKFSRHIAKKINKANSILALIKWNFSKFRQVFVLEIEHSNGATTP